MARRSVTSVKASRIVDRRAGLVDHLAGVQQHGAPADAGKVVVDLEAVHGGLLGNDGLEQQAQGRDVPPGPSGGQPARDPSDSEGSVRQR